jgi:hypothetical protein
MAKDRYRVKAEDAVVAGHKTGEEFSFDEDGEFNVEALIEAGIIEPVKAEPPKKKEE